MAGNVAGGKKAAETNMSKYGRDFYAIIGSKGGKRGHYGGFNVSPDIARSAGAIGGAKSKRGPAYKFCDLEKAKEDMDACTCLRDLHDTYHRYCMHKTTTEEDIVKLSDLRSNRRLQILKEEQ